LEKKRSTENKTAAKEGKKDAPHSTHIYKKEFSGGRTIISIPWETHADVREKHILQMEMEVDVGP